MKAILRTTTNHGMSHYSDREGKLSIDMKSRVRWTGEERDDTFHTSSIVSHIIDGDKLILNTLNSVYIFEILEEEGLDLAELEATPQWMIDQHRQRNETKYMTYWCQIIGNVLTNNAISVALLPYPMNLQEARDYAATKTLTDIGGNIVYNVMAGKDLP